MHKKRLFLLSFFIFFLLLGGHYLGWLKWPENFLSQFLGLTTRGVYVFEQGLNHLFSNWFNSGKLAKENQECQNQLLEFSLNQSELKQIKEENEIFRAQLDFLKEKKKFVVANIIGKTTELSRNLIIIDKGLSDGIKIDTAAIAKNGILIGKVIKTETSYSLVRLLTDSQSKIGATVLNRERTIGVVSGEYNLKLKLTMIPLTETVITNDQVITSGLETGIPRGLLIGKIESVQKELYQPFQKAEIKSALDLNKLSIITILSD